MTNQRHISKPPNRLLWLLFSLFMLKSALAADLVFDPATPTVVVGQQITLSVSGTSGDIIWTTSKGQIQGAGNLVTYIAPEQAGVDTVVVIDAENNVGTVKITVTAKLILQENANWEVFTNRSWINTLLLSDNGKTLWVGTIGGLEQRDATTGQLVRVFTNLDGLPTNNVQDILNDDSGGLWVTVFAEKGADLAYKGPTGEWELFNSQKSDLPESYKNALAHRSPAGDWSQLDISHSGLPAQAKIQTIVYDEKGGIWVGTRYGGLAYLSASGKWTVFNDNNSEVPYNSAYDAIAFDKNGGLWIGARGISHRNALGEWSLFNSKNSKLPHDRIFALISDNSNGLWIGTAEGLAYRTATNEWSVFNVDNSGLPNNQILALQLDNNGGVWVGTGNGLAYRNITGKWNVLTPDNSGLPSHLVEVLLSDGNGGLWVGTGGGLAYYSVTGEWNLFNATNSNLPTNYFESLFLDAKGSLWIGTEDGLVHRSTNGEWSILNINNSSLPENWITDILSDSNGGLWLGTRGGGLVHRSVLDEWTVYTTDNSGLPSNYIGTLENDGSGGLWIGTIGGGLAHLTFTQKNTLCTNLNDADCQNVLTDKRAAILIHPRGQGSGVRQALSIERMSAHIYRTLQNRGYDNDEIYFLSHKPDVDINGDGMVDRNVVDAPVKSFDKVKPRDLTHADVQQAFEWAKQKGKLDQPLLVIFVDHALTGQLRLDPFTEVLTAPDLNAMLTDYQQATGSEVVVILEACHTGSLVEGLAGPNRLIITSTAENQAYYENLGMFSFSKFFFDHLRRGESFYDAFQTVSGKLPTYGHPFNLQIPQLDDDGDGLANNSSDGRLAQKWCLNGCFGALSGEITLEPETVSGPVTAGQTTPLLVRAGITEGRIKQVWALVMTPEAAKQRNQEGFSLIPTPVVNLTQQADDPSHWQGAFSGFQYRGDYVVTFMAEDNEGFITTTAPIVFTQAEGPEVPEFVAGPDPIPSQTVYQAGEQLRVNLPALPADQKQYIAVSYPDQTLYFMTGLNGLVFFDGSSVPVWEDSGNVAIDQPVTAFPKGEYVVYLLRLPAWIDLLSHPEEWRIGFSTFRVE